MTDMCVGYSLLTKELSIDMLIREQYLMYQISKTDGLLIRKKGGCSS